MDILTLANSGLLKIIEFIISFGLLLWLFSAKDTNTKIDILALFILYIIGFYR